MNDNNDQPDFIGALQEELGYTPPAADDTTPPAPTPAAGDESAGGEQPPKAGTEGEQPVTPPAGEEKPKEGEPAGSQGGEEEQKPNTEEQPKPSDDKQETAEEKANREAEEAAKNDTKPLTAEDIQAAIRADRQETQGRVEQLHQAREEIIEKLYPQGIDRNIYDTNGNVIKTAQDIVDRGLVNERTGEPYTYEEAASFVLEANRKMTENIEELNQWADNVAEQNISLVEGNARVMDQWGDILKAMPQLAEELAKEYITTQLEFDKTGSYIVRMGMAPEAYYNRIMAPYKQLGEALVAKKALEESQQQQAQQQQQEDKQNEQQERNGLPPQRGTSSVKANTGDPMLDALVDELNKG